MYVRTCVHTYVYTRPGGAVEGLILSSVIVAGQRHLCEEQTYLAQQAIHQIAALDKLAVGRERGRGRGAGGTRDERHRMGCEGHAWTRIKTRPEVRVSARGCKNRAAESVARKGRLLCRAERIHSSSRACRVFPRVAPKLRPGIYEPFVSRRVERGETKKNPEYGIQASWRI